MTTKQEIEQTEKKLAILKAKLQEEQNKTKWISIDKFKKGYEITTNQQFNNKTYGEILKLVNEKEIADYPLLQELRNSEKYKFLKDFWVFVPNLDKISKKNNYVARFVAFSDRAYFDCGRRPYNSAPSLGVFLIRRRK